MLSKKAAKQVKISKKAPQKEKTTVDAPVGNSRSLEYTKKVHSTKSMVACGSERFSMIGSAGK